jgi:RNA polymerase sigma-B factor
MLDSRQSGHGPERLDDLDVVAVAYARRWRSADDAERDRLRDELICHCLPFAGRMARRYGGRPEPIEDLEQVARLGLIKAVDRFDPDRGSFTAFAVPTICGEIKRHFRDQTWGVHVNRALQDLTMRIGPATAELTHVLARDPTRAELARHMNVTEEEVRYAQVCAANHLPVPLSMPIDDRGFQQFGDLIGRQDEAIEVLPDRLAIAELLRVLPARIQRIISLRFYSDLTQTQIAEEIGVSQMHVSRLLRHALEWLRTAMLSDVKPRWTGTEHSEALLPTLRILISGASPEVHVDVIGEIDRDNRYHLWRRLHSAIALASPGRLVINLAGTPLADIAGAVVLRDACASAGFAHVAVTFEGLRPLVGTALAIAGLPNPPTAGRTGATRTAPRPRRVSPAHPPRVHRPGSTVVPSGGATAVAGSEGLSMAATSHAPAGAPTDEELRRELLTELAFDAEIGPGEVRVVVDDRVATLTGWVDSLPRKWAAERAALRVRGVRAVANEIEVSLPVGTERTDADIAAAAVQALAWDTRMPSSAVRVSVSGGWVTLHGEVDWQHQRREAQRVIQDLSGIRGITNLTTVRPTAMPAADYVKDRIVSAFLRNAELSAREITVTTAGGKVTLTGTVHSRVEATEADRVAWAAPGVTDVDNRLVVRH